MGLLKQIKHLFNGAEETSSAACQRVGVDAIALLFQTILQEDRLSPLLRVWIARLQTPVMQQALADPDSFHDPKHPARRLLAHFASSAMGFGGAVLPCGALEQEIKRLVLFIEQYPDSEHQVYEQANQQFEEFLAGFQSGTPVTQKVDCFICQKDQKEALAVQYTIALRDLLKDKPAPAELRDVLFKVWTEVLAVNAVRQGLQHADTLALKKTAIDLLSANRALTEPGGHSYAIRRIPRLQQRLRAGMSLLGLPAADQDTHINVISQALAKTFLSSSQALATDAGSARVTSPEQSQHTTNRPGADAEELSGLEVIDDDPAATWRLWDCALIEQDLNHGPLPAAAPPATTSAPPTSRNSDPMATIELHHQRVASVIRSLWSREECAVYINKLIAEGGDGMGHGRIGFNQNAAEAMMALANLHESTFGPLRTQGKAVH